MEEDGERERNRHRLGGRESCCSCNVMLNSNMQCSHHGNGGSSEATHGAENVCLLVRQCVPAWVLCKRCSTISRVSPPGGAEQQQETVFNTD